MGLTWLVPMAISKQAAEERRREELRGDIHRIEHDLDLALIKGTRTFELRIIPYQLRDVIKQNYEMAGWRVEVEYVSDQRDGDYWKFS